jgi:hypothetical protein
MSLFIQPWQLIRHENVNGFISHARLYLASACHLKSASELDLLAVNQSRYSSVDNKVKCSPFFWNLRAKRVAISVAINPLDYVVSLDLNYCGPVADNAVDRCFNERFWVRAVEGVWKPANVANLHAIHEQGWVLRLVSKFRLRLVVIGEAIVRDWLRGQREQDYPLHKPTIYHCAA